MFRRSLNAGAILVCTALLAFQAQAGYQTGADRLTALQNNDGGWDWPLNDGNPATGSAANTIGPIAMGLGQAYRHTGDATHLSALAATGAFLLGKTNNFSTADGYLAADLDAIFGGTTYRDHVKVNFYDKLAAGTYDRKGLGTLYDTNSYVAFLRGRRSGSIANLATWDLGLGLYSAAQVGASTTEWVNGTKAEINELDGAEFYDVIGLAGGVFGLATVGEDFNPTAGEHAAASNLADLAAILAGYQLGTGGFTWNSLNMVVNSDETIQETAYATLALRAFDPITYLDNIQDAGAYLMSVQLGTGGWANYVGGGENNEVTGEALWAISTAAEVPEPASWLLLSVGLIGLARVRRRAG